MAAGSEVAVRIDQTLTQDATGTMAYLQFEAIGIPRVRTELSVSYVDHNTLQSDFKNADDHSYLRNGNGALHKELIEVNITRPEAYNVIDREIKRRLKEGRAMGRQKPKRIFKVENEAEFKRLVEEKLKA
jgi:hypothetical protein